MIEVVEIAVATYLMMGFIIAVFVVMIDVKEFGEKTRGEFWNVLSFFVVVSFCWPMIFTKD